jgi:hypothetical protein
MRAIKQTPVCSNCKSADISVPAFVCWSDDIQDWQITNVEDFGNCGNCGASEPKLEWLDADTMNAKDSLPVDWFPRQFSNLETANWHANDLRNRGYRVCVNDVGPAIFAISINPAKD